MTMGLAEFWSLIDRSRTAAAGDVQRQANELERLLIGRPVADLEIFASTYQALHTRLHRNDVWDAGYLIARGMSDDSFEYFCDWLISRGRQTYELALANPDDLADVPDVQGGEVDGEVFGHAAYDAFRKTHGSQLSPNEAFDDSELHAASSADPPDFEMPALSNEELRQRLPRLHAKTFGSKKGSSR